MPTTPSPPTPSSGLTNTTFLYYIFVILLGCGCAAPRYCREATKPDYTGSQLCGVRKANPAWWLENTDSPLPDWWQPEAEQQKRLRSWKRRNPLHNFTHYVIGVSDRSFCRWGLRPADVWGPCGLNLAVLQTGPFVLPFVSLQTPWIEAYFGWRERGNFGIALRRRD